MEFKELLNEKIMEGEYVFTFSKAEVEALTNQVRNELISNIKAPGFRPGKVPTDIASKYINENDLFRRVTELARRKAFDFIWSSQEITIHPWKQSNYDINLDTKNDQYILHFNFVLPPEVIKQEDWRSIKVPFPKTEITEEILNKEVINSMERFAKLHIVDKAAELNDVVNINFQGFLNKKPFANGSAKNFDLKLGSNNFINGFEQQLIGVKAGEDKTIEVRFPDDYQQKDLAGKIVTFDVHVNTVKQIEIPVLNDDFIQSLRLPEVKTTDEYKTMVRQIMLGQANRQAQASWEDEALLKLQAAYTVNMSEKAIQDELKNMEEEFNQRLQSMRVTKEQFLARQRETEDNFQKNMTLGAKARIRTKAIFNRISLDENIQAEINEYEAKIQQLAEKQRRNISEVASFYDKFPLYKTELQNQIIYEKTAKLVFDHIRS